jgi:uncharacterized protein with HEPN domain
MDRHTLLEKILTIAETIEQYFKGIKDYKEFESNQQKIEAISFNFIQLGEYAKKVDPKFIQNNPDLKIGKIVGLRNLFTHNYQGVSIKIVYDITRHDIPILISQIKKILKTKRG